MRKISMLSGLVCIFLIAIYFLGGVTDMYAFKIFIGMFGGAFVLSTSYVIYEANRDRKKPKRS
ncbi:hypothetical protein KC842_03320 [Candidatus Nomurabacteria bacterium]|nr:hypothetical protein [Candidatus Nomurabacteria bacterium]